MSTNQSQDEAPPPRKKRVSIFANLKSGLFKRAIPGGRVADNTVKTEADGDGDGEVPGVPSEEHEDSCSCSQPLPTELASGHDSAAGKSGRGLGEAGVGVGVARDQETPSSSDVCAAPPEKIPSVMRNDDLKATSKSEAGMKTHESSR